MKQISSTLFFAGLVCGCLALGGAFYFFYAHPAGQSAGSDPTAGAQPDSKLASATSSSPAVVSRTNAVDSIQVQLRPAKFAFDQETLQKALELKRAGWTYVMPQPRDARARWGNDDGRTTWWIGYWTNERNQMTSASQPQRNGSGQWVGDGKGIRSWRRGGSPLAPTKIEWLCSRSGGITPQ